MGLKRWTKKPPKRSGYYWHRDLVENIKPFIVDVTPSNRNPGRMVDGNTALYIDNWTGEWFGPIKPPSREPSP